MKLHSNKTSRGFTLVELLVAMAITALIVTILVSITSLSLDTWNRSRSEIRASRQGKAMLDSLARDFESLVVRRGNDFEWLYAGSNPPSGGPGGTSSPNAVDLLFFTAATDRYDGQIGVVNVDLGGDVSAVGYQLAYKDAIGGSSTPGFETFILYRKLINPDQTFTDLLGQTDLEAGFASATSGVDAIDADENFICENIYQFSVTFHVAVTSASGTGPGQTRSVAVPIGPGSAAANLRITGTGVDTAFTSSAATNAEIRSGEITAVEISLTVLSDFGLQQMRLRPLSGTAKDDFIARNSYHYSKIVPVPHS